VRIAQVLIDASRVVNAAAVDAAAESVVAYLSSDTSSDSETCAAVLAQHTLGCGVVRACAALVLSSSDRRTHVDATSMRALLATCVSMRFPALCRAAAVLNETMLRDESGTNERLRGKCVHAGALIDAAVDAVLVCIRMVGTCVSRAR
jgi:hypothetical protein